MAGVEGGEGGGGFAVFGVGGVLVLMMFIGVGGGDGVGHDD